MLDNIGFDQWAKDYDQTVQQSENDDTYPFAGYTKILGTIANQINKRKQAKVLEIGFGTGLLASYLYENGHEIDGIDFSKEMIAMTQPKVPNARLIEWNIRNGLPPELEEKKYDFIVSTYTLHHLTDEEKAPMILELMDRLTQNGVLMIGDISFQTRNDLEKCRKDNIDHWDEDEFYFVYKEIEKQLSSKCHINYNQISHCGGLFKITKNK